MKLSKGAIIKYLAIACIVALVCATVVGSAQWYIVKQSTNVLNGLSNAQKIKINHLRPMDSTSESEVVSTGSWDETDSIVLSINGYDNLTSSTDTESGNKSSNKKTAINNLKTTTSGKKFIALNGGEWDTAETISDEISVHENDGTVIDSIDTAITQDYDFKMIDYQDATHIPRVENGISYTYELRSWYRYKIVYSRETYSWFRYTATHTIVYTVYKYEEIVEIRTTGGELEQFGAATQYHAKPTDQISSLKLNKSGYTLRYFMIDTNSDGKGETRVPSTTLISALPANNNLYAVWMEDVEYDSSTDNTLTLTSYINSFANSQEAKIINIYPETGSSYNLTYDPTYDSTNHIAYLGTAANKTVIGDSVALNLCAYIAGSWKTNQNGLKGEAIDDVTYNQITATATADYKISLEGRTKNVTYVLQNDLTVNGSMYIGGHTVAGEQRSSRVVDPVDTQGHIAGNYVELDLNGRVLTVEDGAILHSFGNIIDSKGTGKILVKGKLCTPFVIDGAKGGNNIVWSYAKGLCPFDNYLIPYLDCKVEIDGIRGGLTVFSKIHLGSLGLTNIYLDLVGAGSGYLLKTSSGTITLTTVKNEALKGLSSYIDNNLFYYRNRFDFDNVSANMQNTVMDLIVRIQASRTIMGMTINIDESIPAALQTSRLTFPISSFWELNFQNGSLFVVNQPIKLMPGCVLNVDESSTLKLDYYKNSDGTIEQQSFAKIEKQVSIATKTIPGETKYVAGSIFAFNETPYYRFTDNSYQNFVTPMHAGFLAGIDSYYYPLLKYYQQAHVNIYGTLDFASGNSGIDAVEAGYRLSGNINISQFSVDGGPGKEFNSENLKSLTGVKLETYGQELINYGCVWFLGTMDGILGDNNSTASFNAVRYYVMPLISNGLAYIKDSNNNLVGSYEQMSGIFTDKASEDKYVLLTNSKALKNGGAQEAPIDYAVKPAKVNLNDDHTVSIVEGITVGDGKYTAEQKFIYYAGYFAPASAVADGVVTADISKLSTTTALSEQSFSYFSDNTYFGMVERWKRV